MDRIEVGTTLVAWRQSKLPRQHGKISVEEQEP